MDPLTIFGGISAIGGIAFATSQMAIKLHRIARNVGSVRDEVKTFATSADSFSTVISMAHDTLRRYCSEGSNTPEMLRYMYDQEVISRIVADSRHLSRRIKEVKPQMNALKSRFDWMCRIKWVLQKKDVQALRLEMESVKTSLTLVFMTLKLDESIKRNPQSAEV